MPTGPVINAVNLGAAEVNGTPVTMTLTYGGSSSTLTTALTVGTEFAVTSSSCTVNACTATVRFTPSYPGRRDDALTFTDSSNAVIYKTYLRGLGQAPQLRFDLGGYTGFYGFTSSAPQSIAVAPDGKVYVTEAGSNQIVIVPVNGNIFSFTLTGLASPGGIVVDGSNILYVADQTNNTIISFNLTTQFQTNVTTTALLSPGQLAIDGTGALYIADTGHGRIIKIDNQGTETTVATGLTQPTAVAVDSAGNVFLADTANNGEILEKAAGSTQTTTVASNLSQTPRNLAVGADGVVYLTTEQGVQRFYQGNSAGTEGDGNGGPVGLAIKPNGGVVFTTPGANSFTIIDPQAGANFILSSYPTQQAQGGFTVSNTGNEPLTLANLVSDDSRYIIDANSECQPGTVLAPQQRCNVTVYFTPTIADNSIGHIVVTSNNLRIQGSTASFNVYGQGEGDASHTDLTAAPSAVMVGNPVRLLATIVDDGGNATPTGTVMFYDGSILLGTATLAPPSTHVEITVSNLSVGTHDVHAAYSGDGYVKSNTSNDVTVVVSSGPPDPNHGVVVGSHDFGSANVGANGGTLNFSYQQNSESISASGDFELGVPTCDGTCTVTVTFKPKFPGLRSGVISRFSDDELTSKTFAYGAGIGPQLGFNSGTNSVYGNLQAPGAIAVRTSSNSLFGASALLAVADIITNQVYESTADGLYPLPIRNLRTPAAVAIGPDGKVYVADSTNNLVFTFDVPNQQEDVLATSQLSHPNGVVVDGAGNVYILDAGNKRVIKLTPQGVETTLASNVQNLTSIALDSAGNVFYGTATSTGGTIVEIPAGGGQSTEVVNGLGPIYAVALDASGAIYSQNSNFTNILPPPPQNQYLLGYEFPGNAGNRETGLALGANGDVYASNSDTGQYFISNRSTGNQYSFVTVGSTGMVTARVFNDGNAPLALSAISVSGPTFTLLNTGTCATGTAIPPGGNCTVDAKYTPTQPGENHEYLTLTSNSLNNTSSSNTFDFWGEAKASTTTTLTATPTTSVATQNVTFRATVTESTNTPPGGLVTFQDGSTVLGTANLGYQTSGGTATATFPYSSLSVGTHSITATYAGDNNFAGSTSAPLSYTVTAGTPPTTTSTNFGSVAVGQTVAMTISFAQGVSSNIYLASGSDFHISSQVCNTSCQTVINFTPVVPGVRKDALTVRDSNGIVVARAFLYGIGTSGQFGFLPGQSSIDSNIVAPVGITFTEAGVGFVTDAATGKVYELVSGEPTLPITGLVAPAGIAIDGAQTIYIADQGTNRIITYSLLTQVQGMLATSPLVDPGGIAVDGVGNIFISDNGNNRIIKISNQGTETTMASGLSSPQGIAVDAVGNIYFADNASGGRIARIPAAGGAPVALGTALGNVLGLAVDASGSVYYVGSSFSGIRDLTPGGTSVAFSGNLSGSLTGIALNFNGDVWTTQPTTSSLEQLRRADTSSTSSTQVGTPVSHTVRVVNTGNTPLTLSNVAFVTGTVFTIGSGNTCTSGSVLQPGALCQTPVQFLPTAAQFYSDSLNYTTNALNLTGSVNSDSEVGTGTAPTGVPSTTTLNAAPSTQAFGGYVDFTATVVDTSGITPTGTVSFYDGITLLGTSNLSAGQAGSATAGFSSNTLSAGTHNITATYAGTSAVATSTSAPVTVTITPPPAQISSQNFGSVAVGQSVTQNVTVTLPGITSFSFGPGHEYTNTQYTCTSTSCTVPVKFAPVVPGLRPGALIVKDTNGIILAKIFLYGTGTGPQFGFLTRSGSPSTPFASPTSITFTADGIGYVTDASTNKVYPLYTGAEPLPISGLGTPGGIAVDGSGVFYIADKTNNRIVTYNSIYNLQGVLSTSALNNPGGVAVDGTGAVYVVDTGNNRLLKIDNQGAETTLASGLNAPKSVALDAAGNVYYDDLNNFGEIVKLPVAGGSPSILATALGNPLGLAVEASGSIYYVGSTFNGIRYHNPSGGNIAFSGATTGSLAGIGLNFNGDIWTLQTSTGKLEQLHRSNAVFVSTAPAGSSMQHTLQVVNTGNAPLTISNIAFQSGTVFSVLSNSPCLTNPVILPGSECDTYVKFAPTTATTTTDSLIYTSNSLNDSTSTASDGEVGNGTVGSTTTTVSLSSSTVLTGQPVTITATIQAGAPIGSGGSVTFVLDGTTGLGIIVPTSTPTGGTASVTVSSIPAGTHQISAIWSGNNNYGASTSAPVTLTVSAPAASTTNLSITAAGQPVTTTSLGTAVKLTASVANGQTPVTRGVVTFCDAAAAYCTDIHVLGTAQLTANGTASITIRPGVGSATYKAVFAGTTAVLGSSSAASTLTVTGKYATATTVSSSGSAGNYTLSASVTGSGSPSAIPSGTVSFIDTTNANATLATATLGNGTATQMLRDSASLNISGNPRSVVTGDFNGDGNQDFAVVGINSAQSQTSKDLTVYLGNGDGTFTLSYSAFTASSLVGVVAADFNSDGKLDLALTDASAGNISILLGNGDGTFANPLNAAFPGGMPNQIISGDFNGDGTPDVIVSNYGTTYIGLGVGDGTLGALTQLSGCDSVGAVGDFNGDGKLDFACYYYSGNVIVSVFPGNGDGTFQTPGNYQVNSSVSYGIAVGDFNGDGKLDLAVGTRSISSKLSVLLGNGDGTFGPYTAITAGSAPSSPVVGDFDHDGKADIAVISNGNFSTTILKGNGSGAFTVSGSTTEGGGSPIYLATADFDGDGLSDLVEASIGGDSNVYLSYFGKATASASGVAPSGAGTHQVVASYGGDNSFATSTSAATPLSGSSPVASTTTLAASPTTATAGSTITLTATVNTGSITPTGTVTFFDGTTSLGTASLGSSQTSSATAQLNVSTLAAGPHSITATYGGSTSVSGSTSASQTVTINAAASSTTTTLVITAGGQPATQTTLGTPVRLTATVLSGQTALTRGVVNFCDATATYCTDVHILGTAQLTSAGTASIVLQPGVGAHSYKAMFAGVGTTALTSTSTTAALTVTGKDKSTTSITSSGSAGNYTLTASTLGAGSRNIAASGTVSFLDTSNNNAVVATAPYTVTSVAPSFNATQSLTLPGNPNAVASGDFNGDGLADFVVVNFNTSQNASVKTLNVLLSNGDGTFTNSLTSRPAASLDDVKVADFNNDGKLDIAIASYSANTIYILPGNGDGTFGTALTVSVTAYNMVLGDFNRDGNMDIAIRDVSNRVRVLLGNGDGTFNIGAPTQNSIDYMAVGDVNGDGRLDLLVGNSTFTLQCLLGNGTGGLTGGATISIPTGHARGLALADLNGDGKLDLVIGFSQTNLPMYVALGDGAGNFGALTAVSGSTNLGSSYPTPIDFNHDGGVDIATADFLNSSYSVFIGSGNGQFGSVITMPTVATSSIPLGVATGDFDGDGVADVVGITNTGNTADVLLSRTSRASATASGVSVSPGSHAVVANFPGDANYQASTSGSATLTGASVASTTTTLTASPSSANAGQDVVITATIAGRTSPQLSGLVTFYDGTTAITNAAVTPGIGGGSAQITISSLSVGSHTITATYNGDSNYTGSTSNSQTVTVTQPGTTVNSQNFGSAQVNGSPVAMTLTYTRVAGGITLALVNANDFTMSQQTCTQTTCSTTVTFTPKFPGVRTDALTVKDSNGNLIAKTFLYGTGTAPQFGFQPGLASKAFVGLVTNPTGVAVGSNGSIYVSDTSNNRVLVQFPSGSTGTIAFPTLGSPGGLAVDGSNTVYVADRTNNVILASSASGVVSTVATSALSSPNFLAVDGTGALYIADTGNNRILKIDNQGVQTTARTLQTSPLGIAVDAAGALYYADAGNGGEITMVNASGFGSTAISGLGATINALGVDAAGRLYYTALNGGVSSLFTSRLGAGVTAKYAVSSATQAGAGLAVDGGGTVIITEPSIGQVDVYSRIASNASLTAQPGTQAQTTFTIGNTGNTALTLRDVAVSGSNTFTVNPATTCVIGNTIPVGQTCDVTVDFTPAAAQSYQANIVVNTDSLNTTLTSRSFTVFGTGTSAPASTTSLTVSPSAAATGQPVTLTATVTFASSQPTGTVSFFDGTTPIGSATLGSGSGGTATAQFVTSTLALGTHTILARYAGNGTAPASTSSAQTVTIAAAATTTTLAASPASAGVGQPIRLTATIAGSASPVMSGTVTFFDGTTSLGTNLVTATSTGGTSQITVATLGVGAHSITARYSGDGNYTTSTSAAQTVTVTQLTTTTALTASPASLGLGQTETLTATVGGGSGTPAAGGTVTFFDGTTQLGVVGVTATGTGATASLNVSTLAIGSHSITARYDGDANYTASTSAAQTVSVTQVATTTALTASPASITLGQTETLTAVIAGGSGSPAASGTVSYFDGTTLLGTANVTATSTGGTATLTLLTLSAGTHSITARYNGDTSYAASTTTAQTVTVAQATTTTTLAVSAANIAAGQAETLTATIQGLASTLPTGTVTFFDGTTSLGSAAVTAPVQGSFSTATLTLTTLASGSRSITARYNGDTNYTASTSSAQTVTVSGTSQTITFPTIPTHTLGDAPFTLTATASSGLAVSYSVVSGPATVSGNTVTLTGTGTVVIQATQAGNATYTAATPVSQTFSVVPASPTLTSITPAGAVVGASATTVTVTGTNFSTADTVQVNGSGIATTFINATTLTAVVPASLQTAAATLQVAVFDSVLQKATAALPFTVSATPAVSFTGPTTTQPAQQPTLSVTLTNPYPVALTTTLTLVFAPGSSSLTDDPNVQFATGGRTQTFTIPANSTITPAILLQSGTVAGRITVTLVLTNPSGVNVTPANVAPLVITIPPVVPAISTTNVARSGKLLTVTVHAFSNTREITKAIFHFNPGAGFTVDTPDITADVSAAFAAWFSSTASQQYGSSFTYSQDFTLSNDASTIGSVTVTLVNSVGQSTVGTAQ